MVKTFKNVFFHATGKLKNDKLRFILFIGYLIFTLFSAVYFFTLGQIRNGLLPVAYAALFIVMLAIFEYFLKMDAGNLFLVILFSVPVGGILGTCYEFYMLIPFFDTLLHTISGFIFAALGYSLMERLLLKHAVRSRLISVLFALCFSLAIALLWELFEWLLTTLMNGDMLEDTVVYNIRSYLLSGSHNETVDLLDISKTVIYHSGGAYELEGYLDLGGLDSLVDMSVCLAGAVAFGILSLASHLAKKDIVPYFAPKCNEKITNTDKKEEKASV